MHLAWWCLGEAVRSQYRCLFLLFFWKRCFVVSASVFVVILLFSLSLSVAHREPIVDWRQAAKGGLQTGVVDIPAEVQGLLGGEEDGEGDEEDKGDEGDSEDEEDEEEEEDKEHEEDEEAVVPAPKKKRRTELEGLGR